LQFSVLTSKLNKVHDEMMTEGGASKKKWKPSIQESTNPPKRERTKQRKTRKQKNRNPNPRKALNLFFPTYFFAKT
jgi:hypothetical protein